MIAYTGNIVLGGVGDVVVIDPAYSVWGLESISSFSVQSEGETANRYLVLYIKYSLDGVNFTEWLELTPELLTEIPYDATRIFYMKFKAVRGGSDASGEISLQSVSLEAAVSSASPAPAHDRVFPNISSMDIRAIRWHANVLEKLYRGIIPKYITRGANANESGEDDDFMSLWGALSHFFAFFVVAARDLGDRMNSRESLYDYLIQRGMMLSDDQSMGDLRHLAMTLRNQFSLRGTSQMFSAAPTVGVDGEFMRSIGFIPDDYFAMTLTPLDCAGWLLGKSSPMYRGTYGNPDLIAGYERGYGFLDIGNYPIIGSPAIEDGELVLEDGMGIGGVEKPIPINRFLDYSISVEARRHDPDTFISVGVVFLDEALNVVSDLVYLDGDPVLDDKWFFESVELPSMYRPYVLECFVHRSTRGIRPDASLACGWGRAIIIPRLARYIIPQVLVSGAGGMILNDIKVSLASTPYSLGFMNLENLIQIWSTNNNGMTQLEEVALTGRHPITYKRLIKYPELEDRYVNELMPYDSQLIVNWLPKEFPKLFPESIPTSDDTIDNEVIQSIVDRKYYY